MQHKLLHTNPYGLGTHPLVLDEGDEVIESLRRFAEAQNVSAASLTGIGAFSEATLGFFDLDKKDYDEISVDEQTEVLTLTGNVSLHEDKPKIHAHVILGQRDGTAIGGHLVKARVRPTLEITVTETPKHLTRTIDERTGLPLLSIE